MRKNFASVLIAACLLAAVSVAGAGPDEGRKYRGHGRDHGMMMGELGDPQRMLEHMSRRLQLDETQERRISNVLGAAGPEMQALHERGMAARESLAALDTNDPDYDAKLQNLSLETGEIATSMTLLHGRLRSEISAELTDEQKQEFVEARGHMRERFGGRHQRRSDDSVETE